jgi:hypothetical protein
MPSACSQAEAGASARELPAVGFRLAAARERENDEFVRTVYRLVLDGSAK